MAAHLKFSADEKAKIAAGWESSGQTQEDYAQARGIDARTLRAWRKRVPKPKPPSTSDVLQAIDTALGELDRLRTRLLAFPGPEVAPRPQERLQRFIPGQVNLANVVIPRR